MLTFAGLGAERAVASTMVVLEWLLNRGRVGGGISLVVSAGFFGLALYPVTIMLYAQIILFALGAVFGLLGVLLLALGRPGGGTFEMPEAGTVTKGTERLLRRLEYPYWFCTRCIVQAEYGSCPRCVRTVDVMEVRDASDLKLLRAALGLD